jgi:hypothetical protein
MSEFKGYGEEDHEKITVGWCYEMGWGNGSAPGGGDQWGGGFKTFSDYYDEFPAPPKPSLGNFLIYAFCVILLLLALWMI